MDCSTAIMILTLWAATATTLLVLAGMKMQRDAAHNAVLVGRIIGLMERAQTQEKASQSQCTYTSLRGVRDPRFLVLPESSQC
jgi:hypothetical protein